MLHHRLRAAAGARGSGGGGGIPTDYIAFYTMDNISGSTLVDETGAYDGTINGVAFSAGCSGQAAQFEGNVLANIALPIASQISDTMTVSARIIKGASLPCRILNTASLTNDDRFSGISVLADGAALVFRHTGSAYAETLSSESGFSDCSRYTFRWDAGVLSVMAGGSWLTFPDGSRNLAENPDIGKVDVGALIRSTLSNDGGGSIDEMYIYDYALTNAECLALDGV